MTPRIDLDAYCERIGFPGPREPTLACLQTIHSLHTSHIPFENLDVLLGLPIRLDLESLQRKLVHQGRGGYCFEQNALLSQALRAIGFDVQDLSARVCFQLPPGVILPRTHMLLRVGIEGISYLADVGFGGLSLTAPIELFREGPQATPFETHRVRWDQTHQHATLEAQLGEGWVAVYEFWLEVQRPIDYDLANWYTSTHPHSRFKQHLLVARPRAGVRHNLLDQQLTLRGPRGTEKRLLHTRAELLQVLRDCFGLQFPAETVFTVGGSPFLEG